MSKCDLDLVLRSQGCEKAKTVVPVIIVDLGGILFGFKTSRCGKHAYLS